MTNFPSLTGPILLILLVSSQNSMFCGIFRGNVADILRVNFPKHFIDSQNFLKISFSCFTNPKHGVIRM
eukprot:snap_masked-scaffold_1-processed-gene-16.77-mRNA-1 protein AED:1.00 eAED:1.00 QI:0/0/0/0/1/1/2/0/68